jgi:tRNA modification GTPase
MTPPGTAAIAVVRLSGAVLPFLNGHFSRPVRPGRCVHGEIADGPRVLDDAVVVLGPGGAWADVNLHGGTWVVRSFLELARRNGFAVVEANRLPLPDAAADADSVLEAEVLSHLPMARTELGVRVLLGQQAAWERLKAQRDPEALHREFERLASDATLRHLLHPPRVAIVGAANVGKSTLANCLFGQARSITADVPGTTRDWVGDVANLNGLPVTLVDTPGWRATEDAIERTAIERSKPEIELAGLVLLVLDVTRPLEPEQRPLIEQFPGARIVINKCDGPRAWEDSTIEALCTVATSGEGVPRVMARIVAHFCGVAPLPDRAYCWTERQQRLVESWVGGKVPPILDAI